MHPNFYLETTQYAGTRDVLSQQSEGFFALNNFGVGQPPCLQREFRSCFQSIRNTGFPAKAKQKDQFYKQNTAHPDLNKHF